MGQRADLKPRKRRNPPGLSPPGAGSSSRDDYAESRTIREREDARYRKIKADQAQIALDVSLGKFHSVDECRRFHSQQYQIVRKRLMSLHRDLPPQLAGLEPRQMSTLIDKRVREILQALADGK